MMAALLWLAFWLLVFVLVLSWVELLTDLPDLPDPDTLRAAVRAQRNQAVIEAYQRGEFTPQQWAELLTRNAGLRAQWERRNDD